VNIIETKAPIPIDDIKKYFTDKSIFYNVDYDKCDLKGSKLLTYLSNLDLPCDIKNVNDDLICDYLNSISLVTIPSLEKKVIQILLEFKGILKNQVFKDFIEKNKDILQKWVNKLESLRLYNMYMLNSEEFRSYVESFPKEETKDISGINFVSLLKNQEFYLFYNTLNTNNDLKYYVNYFNDYMFKGKNLFAYWSSDKNPLFLLTWATANGKGKEYIHAKKQDKDIIKNVSSI